LAEKKLSQDFFSRGLSLCDMMNAIDSAFVDVQLRTYYIIILVLG